MRAKNKLILLDKVDRFWNKIADQSEEIINKKVSELSLRDRNSEIKRKEIIDSLKKNNLIVNTYYNMANVIHYLENNKRPSSFASSRGEVLFSYFIEDNLEVDLHHGHLYVMGKYNTIYWINSPVTNEIIIVLMLEEHPKSSRGYSKKELKKRLPKIPKDVLYPKSDKEHSQGINYINYKDYPENLNFNNSLGYLTRVSINEYRIGAIYKDSNNKFYFFLKVREFIYVYFKLTNSGLKKLFKYKFDSKSYNENPMKLTLIKDILKMNSKRLKLLVLDNKQENISSINYEDILSLLNQQEIDNLRYKSVNESLELIMLLEDIYLEEMVNIIKNLDI